MFWDSASLTTPRWDLILPLLCAHLLADFPLQPRKWVADRRQSGWASGWLYLHAGISAALAYLLLGAWSAWWILPAVGITHLLSDRLKASGPDNLLAFLWDQAVHLLVILAVAALVEGQLPAVAAPGAGAAATSKAGAPDILLVLLTAWLLLWWAQGTLIDRATMRWRAQLTSGQARGLPEAGLWIGRLERSLIFLFVLLGRYEGIGFLIAAKSVFRFGEVTRKDQRMEAEYILIGTMGSFLLAILTGLAARALMF